MAKLILRVKMFPWALLLEAGLIVRGRWRRLPERERRQLVGLARRSRGWPGNLSPKERAELRRILGRLDARTLAGELVALRRARRLRGAAGAVRIAGLARRGR